MGRGSAANALVYWAGDRRGRDAGRVVGLARAPAVRREERDRHEERLLRRRRRGDQLVGAAGDEVGRVDARVGAQDAVLVDRIAVVAVGRRVDRPVPVVEARRDAGRSVAAIAVEELADVHGPVAGALQPEREPVGGVEAGEAAVGGRVGDHAVVVGVLPGVERRARGAAERVVREAAGEGRALVADQARVFGRTDIESNVWSSVISTRMFGRAWAAGARASSEGQGEGKPGAHMRVNTGRGTRVRCARQPRLSTRYARGSLGFRSARIVHPAGP